MSHWALVERDRETTTVPLATTLTDNTTKVVDSH